MKHGAWRYINERVSKMNHIPSNKGLEKASMHCATTFSCALSTCQLASPPSSQFAIAPHFIIGPPPGKEDVLHLAGNSNLALTGVNRNWCIGANETYWFR
jgi:hypothetical protein